MELKSNVLQGQKALGQKIGEGQMELKSNVLQRQHLPQRLTQAPSTIVLLELLALHISKRRLQWQPGTLQHSIQLEPRTQGRRPRPKKSTQRESDEMSENSKLESQEAFIAKLDGTA